MESMVIANFSRTRNCCNQRTFFKTRCRHTEFWS